MQDIFGAYDQVTHLHSLLFRQQDKLIVYLKSLFSNLC